MRAAACAGWSPFFPACHAPTAVLPAIPPHRSAGSLMRRRALGDADRIGVSRFQPSGTGRFPSTNDARRAAIRSKPRPGDRCPEGPPEIGASAASESLGGVRQVTALGRAIRLDRFVRRLAEPTAAPEKPDVPSHRTAARPTSGRVYRRVGDGVGEALTTRRRERRGGDRIVSMEAGGL